MDKIFICEGEKDCLCLLSRGVSAFTSTHGAGTFKQEWVDKIFSLKPDRIYICYDLDDAGATGASRTAELFIKSNYRHVYLVSLPESLGKGGDISDYFKNPESTVEELINTYSQPFLEEFDQSMHSEMYKNELIEVLSHTIKKDDSNKVILFLCMLMIYTYDSQFNVSINGKSSSGKTFLALEVSKYFYEHDVIKLGHSSSTSFFHDGVLDEETQEFIKDLSQKILIFLDQDTSHLLERLRPMLSHDQKEILAMITDKSDKQGMRTKKIRLIGYPAVIYCSANMNIDEQESTRFILLSPETDQEKIQYGIHEAIKRESNKEGYTQQRDLEKSRLQLKKRINAIKFENIKDIRIDNQKLVTELFYDLTKVAQARDQRDIKTIISIIKGFALLNLWWRDREGDIIVADDLDIVEGFLLWKSISIPQSLGLSPQIYEFYKNLILPLAQKYKNGFTRNDVATLHYQTYGSHLNMTTLRQQTLPMLESTGLIFQEPSLKDKRIMVIKVNKQ